MLSVMDNISMLNLQDSLLKKLRNNHIELIHDVWVLSRKELKRLGFVDSEINTIIISLQLMGLDLNKKIYR